MKLNVLGILVLTLVFAASATLASAQAGPAFQLGFKALADQLPASAVGVPTENEHWETNGNSEQHTTKGLMVWRKADNWTAYTDGYMTWINGPNGVQSRLNTERFGWESDGSPAPPAAPAPAPTGYRYIDPNAIASNPSAYIGQKVVLEGQVGPNGASYIEFFPYGEIRTDVWHAPWFGVQFFSHQPILKFDSIRVYGTITGEKTEVIRQPGELTYIVISVRINGDRWEPIPLAGGRTPAVQNQQLMALLNDPGATVMGILRSFGLDPNSTGMLANQLRSEESLLKPAYYLWQGGADPATSTVSPSDYVKFAGDFLGSMGGSLGNVRGQVMSALGAAPGQSQGWNTMLSGIDPSTGQPYLTDQERQDWANRLVALVN